MCDITSWDGETVVVAPPHQTRISNLPRWMLAAVQTADQTDAPYLSIVRYARYYKTGAEAEQQRPEYFLN